MAATKLLEGGPRHVVTHENDHTFQLDEDALECILLREDVRDKPVVVVSVVGAARKGKSFLLNFFLRYMRSSRSCENWLGSPTETLKGFSWRRGSKSDTSGIVIWDEVFTVKTSNGKELAVIFMDTEGTFGCGASVKDNATIFGLSALLSSVLVCNISQKIQENDLQYIQVFTEYGRLVLKNKSAKPFQKLLFLVRDWSYPYENPYGEQGGKNDLKKWLNSTVDQHEEVQQCRKHIKSCFSTIQCFLLPYPGDKVASGEVFNGCLSDITYNFKVHLGNLVHGLLTPDNLIVKKVNGRDVTCQELLMYFKAYMKIFKDDKLPEPMSIFQATAEVYNLRAVATAKEKYNNGMFKCHNPNHWCVTGNRQDTTRCCHFL